MARKTTNGRRVAQVVLPCDEQGRLIVDSYARMSVGLDGKEENVENQLDDNRRIIERNGWALGQEFFDGLSAWKRGVRRPGWEKLLERMKQGATGGVVIWHQDRLMRQPRDLEQLFDLADERDLQLASAHGRHDLKDPQARFLMRNIVAHACLSSDDTSRRSRRRNEGRRERGQLIGGGPRAFAWAGGDVTPARLEQEREALRRAFQDVLDDVPLAAIARRWNEAKLFACFGNEWNTVTIRQVMSRQRYAGRIEYEGEVVGIIADHEPLIEPEVFDQVQAIFAGRKRGAQITGRHLASGIIRCSECGGCLVSHPRYRHNGEAVPAYKCCKPKGCGKVGIDQAPVNEALRALTIQRLSDPRIAGRVSRVAKRQGKAIEKLQKQLASAREAEVSLTVKLASGGMTPEAFNAGHQVLFARVTKLEAELAAAQEAAADVGQVTRASRLEVTEEWDTAAAAGDVEKLRAMVKSALRLQQVTVRPARRPDRNGLLPTSDRISVADSGPSVS